MRLRFPHNDTKLHAVTHAEGASVWFFISADLVGDDTGAEIPLEACRRQSSSWQIVVITPTSRGKP